MRAIAPVLIALTLAFPGRAEAGTAVNTDSTAAAPSPAPAPPAASPWPSAVQVGAPSINSASPDLVDHSGFPALAGVAWDERLEKGPDDRAITVNLTPLAVAHVAGLDGPGGSNDLLERVAARVTIGGPLQKISHRFPGRAGRPSNHITSELKMVLHGDGSETTGTGRSTVALALVADNLATGYGLDRYAATLIAEHGGPCLLTANAGYRVVERFHAPMRIEETKLATGLQWRMFGIAERPVEVSVSGGCLLRTRNNADWQDAAQVEVPITHALRISAAMRRSERPELPGQDTMREVVSFAYALNGSSH